VIEVDKAYCGVQARGDCQRQRATRKKKHLVLQYGIRSLAPWNAIQDMDAAGQIDDFTNTRNPYKILSSKKGKHECYREKLTVAAIAPKLFSRLVK
jgi:hypothetical protein